MTKCNMCEKRDTNLEVCTDLCGLTMFCRSCHAYFHRLRDGLKQSHDWACPTKWHH